VWCDVPTEKREHTQPVLCIGYKEDESEGKPVRSYTTHSRLWLVQYAAAVTLCTLIDNLGERTLDGAGTKECIG
jgi:hypothetical protein